MFAEVPVKGILDLNGLNYIYQLNFESKYRHYIALRAKSDSDIMFCLQSYQELLINRSLAY